MQPFKIHILGCGSALPTAKHNPSSQIVEIRGKLFMVDCGEGTQLQIRKSRLNFSKLYAVFISHLHGDHVLGLVGMLSTFGLNGRTAPLNIYAPGEYEELLRMELKMFCSNLDYEIIFHPVDTRKQQIIYEDRSLTVETIPLHHRMPCAGFLFREKPGDRHIRRDMIDFYSPTHGTQSLSTSTNQSADVYYGSRTIGENVKIKPNIYYYMDAVERKVLKKIMEKKPGYEKYKLH